MNEIVEDFEGKKFEVANKGTGNEVWISIKNPDWKFIAIDMSKYQDEDALDLGLPYSNSATGCGAKENLEEVMPIIDKMFLPCYNGRYIQATAKMGNKILVCNASTKRSAKYEGSVFAARANTGLGALTRYWDEHILYIKPGATSFDKGEANDKYYHQIRKEQSLKCLDLIEKREKISYLDTTENLYFEKLAGLMKQAIQENAENKVIALAEEISEKAISKYDKRDRRDNINYDRHDAIVDFWARIISVKPELSEKGKFYIGKSRDAYRSVAPYMEKSQGYNYLEYLQKALSYASGENRVKLLEKIEVLVKNTSELSSYQIYLTSNVKKLIPQNKQEEKILINILKTTASRDTNVILHRELLKEKTELASVLLPIMGPVMMMNKDRWFKEPDDWVMTYYEQYKNIIKTDKGLMMALNYEFIQQEALKDHSLISSVSKIDRENFDAFAKIYEEYASRDNNYENIVGQRNVALSDNKNAQEIMDAIKDGIINNGIFGKGEEYEEISTLVQAWLVKNAEKYPNLVSEILKEKELPYVEMCIKNIEKPEKENIASLLKRLKTKEAKSFEDFQDAQEFVTRRDMCMRGCLSFVKEKEQELRAQHPDYTGNFTILNSKKFSYEIAEAGIGDFKTAKRVAQLFWTLNERPEIYGSSYNQYYPRDLLPIARSNVMQDWMYPVMMDAIEKGSLTMSEGRMPSERTLFDCCKAWKICPEMPQRLAKEVGNYSLRGRMLAGAIFEHMCEKGNTTPQEWRENKELHQKFYEELDRAQKMPTTKAFKQYIPNIPVNRKRLVAMGMEEKGIENTVDNFKELYGTMREKGVFETMLAKPEDAKTTFSSRLMVKLARQKNQGK